jgi:hypothetical protein
MPVRLLCDFKQIGKCRFASLISEDDLGIEAQKNNETNRSHDKWR